ncbi:glycosyltransferase [Microbacterium sp. G2-8]|uniref:glycosyltransferase n=1 Tax=Microbacterium sp. G2-8 TaxID=2842454 RepID=UPI001C892A78|nr:glycosyltransferase [Microbacterium sp. G2-8]
MRALIMAFGTRGDIQPYAAFAGALARAGHEVTLAIPAGLAHLAPDEPGIDVEPAGSEMLRLLQEVMPTLSGPRDALRTFGIMKRAMREQMDETWRAAEAHGADVVVHHPKCLAGPHIAEKLGVPGVMSLPLPLYPPTSAFPAPLFGVASFGRRGNRASYALSRVATAAYGGMINDFRGSIGLDGSVKRLGDPLVNPDGSPMHVLSPYSRHVVPIPPDYPPTAHVAGYWFLEQDEDPEPALADFLDAGDPPVYIGFGSMGFGKGADTRREAVLSALAETGLRGVVATGWGGIAPGEAVSKDVFVIDGAPHGRLFPRCAAVVHHGGAGSTAAGLRAGRPSLVVPFLGDQPFWGSRVHAIGAGPAPLAPARLGRELAGRLGQLVGTPTYARRAGEVADLIAEEDGLARGVRVLEEIVG